MNEIITADKLSEALKEELDNYNKAVIEGTKKEAKKAMQKLVRETKATAPVGKRKHHYKDSITSRKEWENTLGVGYIWYVRGSDYRLSHLLENGHAKRNGKEKTKAFKFIKNASDPIIEDYIKSVEEVCKHG